MNARRYRLIQNGARLAHRCSSFTDGSTAVSLVVSHYIVDGLGLAVAVAEALLGQTRDLGLPAAGSRRRLRAVLHDARDAARDAAEISRAVVAG